MDPAADCCLLRPRCGKVRLPAPQHPRSFPRPRHRRERRPWTPLKSGRVNGSLSTSPRGRHPAAQSRFVPLPHFTGIQRNRPAVGLVSLLATLLLVTPTLERLASHPCRAIKQTICLESLRRPVNGSTVPQRWSAAAVPTNQLGGYQLERGAFRTTTDDSPLVPFPKSSPPPKHPSLGAVPEPLGT
jgi:hypothetical protein